MAKLATAAKPATPTKTAIITELKPDADPPMKKKSGLKWVLVVLIVLALAGGGGAWFVMRPASAQSEEPKTATAKAPVFLNLEPFTVNLMEEGGEHYLQVGIVYQMADDKAIESAKIYLPILRNKVLLLLSSKRPSELTTLEGKNKLVSDLIASARESVPGSTPERGIVGAYLSAFVIQ